MWIYIFLYIIVFFITYIIIKVRAIDVKDGNDELKHTWEGVLIKFISALFWPLTLTIFIIVLVLIFIAID